VSPSLGCPYRPGSHQAAACSWVSVARVWVPAWLTPCWPSPRGNKLEPWELHSLQPILYPNISNEFVEMQASVWNPI
jgi:hypothetical protein